METQGNVSKPLPISLKRGLTKALIADGIKDEGVISTNNMDQG